MRTAVFTLALLTSTKAVGFNPETTHAVGIEPQRVFRDHDRVQARLITQPAAQDFLRQHPDWQMRFDEATGAPRALWGGPIPVSTATSSAVAMDVARVLDRHADLLRFEPGTLELAEVNHVKRVDSWYVDFDTPRDGVPVWRGGITARIKGGNLVMIGAMAYGDRPTRGTWTLSPDRATELAIQAGPAPEARHLEPTAERIWLPTRTPEGIVLIASWLVRTETKEVPGKWVHFVAADTGELLSVHNEVRFIDGRVSGLHAERTLDGSPLVSSPMPLAYVSDGIEVALTANDGTFSLPGSEELVTDFDGEYLRVVNTNGENAVLTGSGPELQWTTADATQAEISTWYFLHEIRTWGERVAPEVGMVQGPIRSNVNLTSGTCNAYFDGQLNFYAAGGGCSNTAEISDVNHHEWGHGFHLYSMVSGWLGFDGSLSEGAADTVAFLQTGDSRIAPYFFGGGGAIRNVEPDRRYPEDYVASEAAVHDNGLIFGGAMWDLWHLLMEAEGVEQGTLSTEAIFSGLLKGGPGIAQSYDEALFADDDDGNLANGTPHKCELIDAFGRHGLGPLGGTGTPYAATHTPTNVHASGKAPHPIEIGLKSVAPSCFEIEPVAGVVHYKVKGGGGWKTAELTVTDTEAMGEIPAQELGSFVEYWVEVEDASGVVLRLPDGGDITPYSYFVGPVLEVVCEDFERNRGGFEHDLVSGEEGEGADDWQWGAPAGKGGDPSGAFSGDKVWGNDLGWDDFNGEYQNDKQNRLYTPEITTFHYEGVFLAFQRWLTVEDGVFDRARIDADGTRVWANVQGDSDAGGLNHLDREWTPQAIDLKDVGDDGSVVIEWSIDSDGGLTFGGWTIDDVCIYAPDTPDNRLGINDIEAKRTEQERVDLSWRNPLHDPVERVVVVRNTAHPPVAIEDGDVVWSSKKIEVGELLGIIDDDAPRWDAWYAVYATDGTHALSWTREGRNLAFVPGDGPAPNRNGECGCDVSTHTHGALWGLALLGLLARRRQD